MSQHYYDKVIQEMTIRGLSKKTMKCYTSCLHYFWKHFKGQKPTEISLEDIKQFTYTLKNRNQSHRYINMQLHCIKFFYKHICKPNFDLRDIPFLKERKTLPSVFSREEITTILANIPSIKGKAMLAVCYSAGLRLNELVNLRVKDIDAKQMLIYVAEGKGHKQRYVPLSQNVLLLLREYWKSNKSKSEFLFAGFGGTRIKSTNYLGMIFRAAKKSLALRPLALATR